MLCERRLAKQGFKHDCLLDSVTFSHKEGEDAIFAPFIEGRGIANGGVKGCATISGARGAGTTNFAVQVIEDLYLAADAVWALACERKVAREVVQGRGLGYE